MAGSSILASVLDWLRAGYPEGVPDHDYVPLFALLSRQLSDSDVTAIADELLSRKTPGDVAVVREAILRATRSQPSDADIARVSARLAAGGWPLAAPEL